MLTLLQTLTLVTSLLPSALAIPATLARQTAAPKLQLGQIKAAVPTSAGQIGVNPVDRDLGDALHYSGYINSIDANYVSEAFATVNSDTNSITSSTKWLGQNTQYLGSEPNKIVTVYTASADENGLSKGDISLLLSKGIAVAVDASAKGAIKACNAVSKRDIDGAVLTCLIKQATEAAKKGVIEKFVQSQVIEKWGLKIAQGATVIAEGLAGLTTSETAQAIVVLTAAAILIGKMEEGEPSPAMLAKINHPSAGFGGTTSEEKCKGSKDKTKDSPLCTDKDCLGEENEFCTVGPLKDCACLLITEEKPPQRGSWEFLAAQKAFLQDVLSQTVSSCTLSSATMTGLSGWKGPPVMTYCICGPTQVNTQMAVSGTVTTTLCQSGGKSASAPPGYTNIGGPSKPAQAPAPSPTPTKSVHYSIEKNCHRPPNLLSDWPQNLSMPCQTITHTLNR